MTKIFPSDCLSLSAFLVLLLFKQCRLRRSIRLGRHHARRRRFVVRAGIATSTGVCRPNRATRRRRGTGTRGRGSGSVRRSREPSCLQRLPMLAGLQLVKWKRSFAK